MKKNIAIIILTLLLVCAITSVILMAVYISDMKREYNISKSAQLEQETFLCLGVEDEFGI